MKCLERKEYFAWSNSSVCKLIFPDFMEISVRILLLPCHPLHRGAFWQNLVRQPHWVLFSLTEKCKWFLPSVKYLLYFYGGCRRLRILSEKSCWKNLFKKVSLEESHCIVGVISWKSHWKNLVRKTFHLKHLIKKILSTNILTENSRKKNLVWKILLQEILSIKSWQNTSLCSAWPNFS